MTDQLLHGRLVNADGELLAEGPCWLDEDAGQATLEPERAAGVIQKERGRLSLELDSGRKLKVSDRPIVISLNGQNGNKNARRRIYRLRLLDDAEESPRTAHDVLPSGRTADASTTNHAQDAGAVGDVGEGSPTSQDVSPPPKAEETPAAR